MLYILQELNISEIKRYMLHNMFMAFSLDSCLFRTRLEQSGKLADLM